MPDSPATKLKIEGARNKLQNIRANIDLFQRKPVEVLDTISLVCDALDSVDARLRRLEEPTKRPAV